MGASAKIPIKVAILGGGVSGLAAAFELSDPRHCGAFDVTIHQLGWQLGGKCASGRDMDVPFRFQIKEHGPHIFSDFTPTRSRCSARPMPSLRPIPRGHSTRSRMRSFRRPRSRQSSKWTGMRTLASGSAVSRSCIQITR
jgi:monoamine oxidase